MASPKIIVNPTANVPKKNANEVKPGVASVYFVSCNSVGLGASVPSVPKHAPTLGYQEATSVYVSGLPLDITKEELGVRCYSFTGILPYMSRNTLWIGGQAEESEDLLGRGWCGERRCSSVVY